jgi:hypothetical protein
MPPRLAVWLLIGVCSPSYSGQQEQPKGAAPATEQPSGIRFEKGRLTAKVRNWSLQSVSEQLAAGTGVNIVLAEGLEDVRISAQLSGAGVNDALRDLLSGYDTFFFYDGCRAALKSGICAPLFPRTYHI